MIIDCRLWKSVSHLTWGTYAPADSKQVLNALRATPIAPCNEEYGLYLSAWIQKAQINNPDGGEKA